MLLDINELSEDVIKTIAYNLGFNEADFEDPKALKSIHAAIGEMTKEEAFERYLYWHDIVGLADQIADAYECLDSAEASAEEDEDNN